MADSLPPFGVRQHCQPDKPFCVLKISEPQYNSEIKSHPDALLTYVDEDDGEVITVGSGLELRERLDESTPADAPQVKLYSDASKKVEDRFIHLFDINTSTTSVNNWKNYEVEPASPADPFSDRWEASMGNTGYTVASLQEPSAQSTELFVDARATNISSHRPPRPSQSHGSDLFPSLVAAIPDLVDGLADLLQATSATLKRAAEKSRDTNTSPIEDVFSGMSGIVTEVGNFGLEVLSLLDKQAKPATDVAASLAVDEEISSRKEEDMSFVSAETREDEHVVHNKPQSVTESAKTVEPVQRDVHHTSDPDGCPTEPAAADKSEATARWILDQEPEDVAFASRYPPLINLRRANTVDGLRDIHKNEFTSNIFGSVSVASKDPPQSENIRPSPRVFDAETQRRKEFAQTCFPTQYYSPGLGAGNWNVGQPKRDVKTVKFDPTAVEIQKSSDNKLSSFLSTEPSASTIASTIANSTKENKTTLPGSWPEAKLDDMAGTPETVAESSGAFFNRMMRERGARSGSVERERIGSSLARHRSLQHFGNQQARGNATAETTTQNREANVIRRYNTVSAANPAARLNRPFDPVYSALSSNQDARPEQSKDKVGDESWTRNTYQSHSGGENRSSVAQGRNGFYSSSPSILSETKPVEPESPSTPFPVLEPPVDPGRLYAVPTYPSIVATKYVLSDPASTPYPSRPYSMFSSISSPPASDLYDSNPVNFTKGTNRSSPPATSLQRIVASSRSTLPLRVSNHLIVPNKKDDSDDDDVVAKCVKRLLEMGYGMDPKIGGRLYVYASAAGGDVCEAIQILEEDKSAPWHE